MNKQVARDMLPLVNDPLDLLALQAYSEDRIRELLKVLETTTDMDLILRTQGSISEMRRFSSLRDRVLKDAGDGRTD